MAYPNSRPKFGDILGDLSDLETFLAQPEDLSCVRQAYGQLARRLDYCQPGREALDHCVAAIMCPHPQGRKARLQDARIIIETMRQHWDAYEQSV